jgi:hypothetical protein
MEPERSLPYSQVPTTCPSRKNMARPLVADGGRPPDMEGRCEYIKWAVANNRQGVVLQLEGWKSC